MKLQQAKEVITFARDECIEQDVPELKNALTIAVEAIEAIECGREGLRTEFFTLLPSETKD